MDWIKYDNQRPEKGRLILVYRDIESKQIYSTIWDDEEERWAKANDITHWCYLNYPSEEFIDAGYFSDN